ncbi:MAG: hypothetical protein KTR31_15815 [Myxococcales bacterium]|nr:hypothetical protein [Myxococcales bacterium]
MHEWARRFIIDLAGAECAFFVAMRNNGTVRRVFVAEPGRPFGAEHKARLADGHERWFLFSPYPEESGAYLEWLALDEEVVRRWLGKPLGPDDYVDVRATGARDGWPRSWRVIMP